jgi:glycosyltransferase involved in cell wall biosynthesis
MTNGVSPEFLASAADARVTRESVRREFGGAGKSVVGYAGLHGLAYDLNAVLKTANVLANNDEIQFLLIGDGPEKRPLQEKAKLDRLTNVSFFSTLPAARMPEIFTAMDVVLIIVRHHDLFKGTLPSKLFDAMGAGVPVITTLQGEAQQILETANCGICVQPNDIPAMAEGILTLFRDSTLIVTKSPNRVGGSLTFSCAHDDTNRLRDAGASEP